MKRKLLSNTLPKHFSCFGGGKSKRLRSFCFWVSERVATERDWGGMGSEGSLPEWASKPCIMGIDEAGRGPVLGTPFFFLFFLISLWFLKTYDFDFQDPWCTDACTVLAPIRKLFPPWTLQVYFHFPFLYSIVTRVCFFFSFFNFFYSLLMGRK